MTCHFLNRFVEELSILQNTGHFLRTRNAGRRCVQLFTLESGPQCSAIAYLPDWSLLFRSIACFDYFLACLLALFFCLLVLFVYLFVCLFVSGTTSHVSTLPLCCELCFFPRSFYEQNGWTRFLQHAHDTAVVPETRRGTLRIRVGARLKTLSWVHPTQ